MAPKKKEGKVDVDTLKVCGGADEPRGCRIGGAFFCSYITSGFGVARGVCVCVCVYVRECVSACVCVCVGGWFVFLCMCVLYFNVMYI